MSEWIPREAPEGNGTWEVVKPNRDDPRVPWFVVLIYNNCDGGTAEQHARLIAAAPDLLEAAKYAVERFGMWEGITSNAEDALNALRSAISRATGATDD